MDYPQQVGISVVHLVLSQEINDILGHVEFDEDGEEGQGSKSGFFEEKIIVGKPDPKQAAEEARSKKSNTDRESAMSQTQKDEGEE